MKITEYVSNSPEETKKIASELVSTFHGGEVIKAIGDMGCGKTAFCQGIGKALGVKGIINSPTFNLIKVYQGEKITLYHVDCYRLEGVDEERKGLALDEVMGDKKIITYIEWPNYGSEDIINYHPVITIKLSYLDDEQRKIVIEDERF
jgi:tRNA threonylcarbamoyladenosine biosynthesis protein TsaE